MERIEAEQAAVWKEMPHAKVEGRSHHPYGGASIYGPLLVLLKADKLAVLVRIGPLARC